MITHKDNDELTVSAASMDALLANVFGSIPVEHPNFLINRFGVPKGSPEGLQNVTWRVCVTSHKFDVGGVDKPAYKLEEEITRMVNEANACLQLGKNRPVYRVRIYHMPTVVDGNLVTLKLAFV